MPKDLTIIFVIIGLVTITFFLGYRYGYRDTYNSKPADIEYVNNEFGNKNILTDVQIKPVLGPYSSNDLNDYTRGFMLILDRPDSTDIRLNLKNIPSVIQTPEDKKNNIPARKISFPTNLKLEMASIDPINRSLSFVKISDLNLNPPQNNQFTGELSLTLPKKDVKLNEGVFLMFFDATDTTQNLYEIQLKDYPNLDQSKNKPFLWVFLQN